ncbi:hypothetical protein [Parasitella parasitica]|uniref:Uncharacterized protein n=1 Tax=Parasitella parasitica TaxID=35722 RepID=A0A0B7NXF7_9FUNG|nr:hypothetical protein [Parasitella parasitica]
MNNIIDLSDDSDGSHLAQVTSAAQTDVKDMLCTSNTSSKESSTGLEKFENIIAKFKHEEDEDKFLRKVINEMNASKEEMASKRIYEQILETMFYDKYIYTEENCSEADYIVKLYGPIMENIFRGSGCRLLWGDTKSPFCQNEANDARLDLRIVAHHTQTVPELCISEYAKKAISWKYYYDKQELKIGIKH